MSKSIGSSEHVEHSSRPWIFTWEAGTRFWQRAWLAFELWNFSMCAWSGLIQALLYHRHITGNSVFGTQKVNNNNVVTNKKAA